MPPATNIYSLPTEIHNEILEYLSEDFIAQIAASHAIPLWRDIIRDSRFLQRSRYIRFQSAWQNAVAIHRAISSDSGGFGLFCKVLDRKIESWGMARQRQGSSKDQRIVDVRDFMGDRSGPWDVIELTDSFILEENYLLPFEGLLAQDLKLTGEETPISKLQLDSDLRTTFIRIKTGRLGSRKTTKKLSVFPSHTKDMTLKSFLEHLVAKADNNLDNNCIDIDKLHYVIVRAPQPPDNVNIDIEVSCVLEK